MDTQARAIPSEAIDLLFVDVRASEMDGREACSICARKQAEAVHDRGNTRSGVDDVGRDLRPLMRARCRITLQAIATQAARGRRRVAQHRYT